MANDQNLKTTETCEICGRQVIKQRLTLRLLITQFVDTTFSLDKGFILTFWHLLIKPKRPILNFLNGYRKPYTTPVKYLVVTITVYVLATFFYDFESLSFIKVTDEDEQIVRDFYRLFQRYINVILLFAIPIVSFFSWMFCGFKRYNFAENLVANAYLIGTYNLVTAFLNSVSAGLAPISELLGSEIPNLAYIYPLFGYFHFFEGKWYWRILKAFFMLFFILGSIALLAIGIVFILKMNKL